MASALREARDWRAQDREAEPKPDETPEAVLDDAKIIAKPPGDLLVMGKGELSDHRPWLESQFAAIQAGRERHERRLASQRQEEAAKDVQADPQVEQADPRVEQQDAPLEIAEPRAVGDAIRLRAILDSYIAKLPVGLTARATQIGERVSAGIAWVYAKSRAALSSAFTWSKAKTETLSPAFYDRIATAADRTKRSVNAMVASASAAPLFGKTQAVLRGSVESASSLLARTREAGRRQWLVIAGAVLLICGALMLGSGLLWRTGTPAAQGAAEPIIWSFEAPRQSASDSIVFTLSGTPANFRIGGLTFRGENSLDHPLSGIEAVVKADKLQQDRRLSLRVDGTQASAGKPHAVEVPLRPAAPDDVIPASAPFELVVPFPGDGLSPEEFFETYGGLTLTMRYTAEGRRHTLIQYLSPETLKAQLADIRAMGS